MTKLLYDRIEEELIDRDKSIEDFLEEYDISYNTIKNLKKRAPSLTTYRKIAKFLDESGEQVKRYRFDK